MRKPASASRPEPAYTAPQSRIVVTIGSRRRALVSRKSLRYVSRSIRAMRKMLKYLRNIDLTHRFRRFHRLIFKSVKSAKSADSFLQCFDHALLRQRQRLAELVGVGPASLGFVGLAAAAA